MVSKQCESNYATISGKVSSKPVFSHELYGEGFYYFYVDVKRLSGSYDTIPVMISERLVSPEECTLGREVYVEGQFRSYNSLIDGRSKLMLMVFARDVYFEERSYGNLFNEPVFTSSAQSDTESAENEEVEERSIPKQDVNTVELIGYICKPPVYRKTPFDREISDLLIAVNRSYNRSDYIPCISWGRNARYCSNRRVGDRVKVHGRIQSRTYQKKYADGSVEEKVAYEVSVIRLELLDPSIDPRYTDRQFKAAQFVASSDTAERSRTAVADNAESADVAVNADTAIASGADDTTQKND